MKVTAMKKIDGKEVNLTLDFVSIPEFPKCTDIAKAYGAEYADACCASAMVVRLQAYIRGLIEDGVKGEAAQSQALKYDPSATRARVPVDPKLRALRMATNALASKGVIFADLPKDKQALCLAKCLAEVSKQIAKAQKVKTTKASK